jgi:hypothetical protein
MFKIIGLGAVLALVFFCCCSLGTSLPERLGLGGPSSFQDLLEQIEDEPSETYSSTSDDEEDSDDAPLFGGKLPVIPNPLGESEIDVGKLGQIGDVPVYPGAQPVSEKVSVPGAVSALMGRWSTDLEDEGVAYALYSTPDAAAKVAGWYKTEMTGLGWKTEMALEGILEGSVLSFSEASGDGGVLIYTFDDSESGRTLIFVLRGSVD